MKRIEEPARFWWQGLSPDRFDDCRSIFLRPANVPEELFELVSIDEFRNTYRDLYAAEWGNTEYDTVKHGQSDTPLVFSARDSGTFPFLAPSLATEDLYEPFAATVEAATNYLNTFVAPRLSSTLAAAMG